MALVLLHGTLHVTIYEAASLINENRLTGAAPKFLRKAVENFEDRLGVGKGSSVYYATIDLQKARVGRTRLIKNEPVSPVWNECFHIYCAHNVAHIVISIKDDSPTVGGPILLGRARIPVTDILYGNVVEGWYDLYKDSTKKKIGNSRVRVGMQYIDITVERVGRGLPPHFHGVPYTFFPQRRGCKVTLYQDAHMSNNFLPPIYLAGNTLYKPSGCWEDIFEAISNAKHIIYITGWSVYTEIKLIRDAESKHTGGLYVSLGELLKKKADEGVKVLLLVWDDRTSVPVVRMTGLMATHDEETAAYFQESNVECVLCPRIPDGNLSFVQGMQIGTMFTHHQKTIIVDAPISKYEPDKRRIISFVGGLDLCDGRYDTQEHSLFRTLSTVHKDDFHQPNFLGASLQKGGPREPWHDIHSKLEGPVAWDVLSNFEQRWSKQCQDKIKCLLSLSEISDIVPPSPVLDERDPDAWDVQIFRSIDGGAAAGFPDNPEDAAKAGLVSGKNCTIDRSIHDAYVHAIRRAKNFIYIENQYFLGSSFGWFSYQEVEALHLIPMELTLKIVTKIEAGERFTVYVVMPMWPEGIPDSGSVQTILHWTKQTMEMMYRSIAQALVARQIFDQTPKDYLAFYCLGNREVRLGGEYLPSESPEVGSSYLDAQVNRRFMIYVHSKMMIVDDEYIIVGSANINQRSMHGGRDTEIAMAAYQPSYTLANNSPYGQIHGLRMGLWYEHLKFLDDTFLQPWSLDCIRKINRTADTLWSMYTAESPVDLPGHLLSYPIKILADGTVTDLPGHGTFPDTKGKVLGTKSDVLPPILTS